MRDRVRRWLRRHQLEEGAQPIGDGPLDACGRVAIQPGLFEVRPRAISSDDDGDDALPREAKHSVALDQFNLHAAVRIAADDDVSRERLVRYCARPPSHSSA